MEQCEICLRHFDSLETHHVVGRVGKFRDNPENLIRICRHCHHLWHNKRSHEMENRVYKVMKGKHGEKFPILVNGRPYMTKWIVRIESEMIDAEQGD